MSQVLAVVNGWSMVNGISYAKATSLVLFFAISGYAFSVVTWDTTVNKSTPLFSLVTSATSGQEMYAIYCIGCHGEDGRGIGSYSRDCTVPPADLTQLARGNHGIYPSKRVCQVLRHGTGLPPQGQGYMPIWAPLLKLMNADPPGVTEVRIHSLAEYIETLQDKPAAPRKRPAP
jgi:mono/diheme cytochrome c family protein